MSRSKFLFGVFIALFAVSCAKPIVIVYDNDVHCKCEGYPSIAFVRDSLKADALVSAGDFLFGGTLGAYSRGVWMTDIINSVGYDVVTIGNHELDKGVTYLMDNLVPRLDADITCCNFYKEGDDSPLFKPYVIKRFGRKKVAFVGALNPMAFTSCTPAYFRDKDWNLVYSLHGDDITACVQANVDAARAEGVDYVVLLSHIGLDKQDGAMTSDLLISQTRGIDVVLDGHSHTVVPYREVENIDGNPVVLTQTGCYFAYIGVLEIDRNGKITTKLIPTANVAGRNVRVAAVVDSLQREFDIVGSRVIGESLCEMPAQKADNSWITRNAEAAIGDFVGDAFRYVAKTDCAIINGGGVRAGLAKGPVNFKNIFDVQPFDSAVCIAEVPGALLIDILEYSAHSVPGNFGGFGQVSGLRYTIDSSVPSPAICNSDGEFIKWRTGAPRRVSNVQIFKNGCWRAVKPLEHYTFTAPSFLMGAGCGFNMMRGIDYTELDCNDVQALETYIKEALDGVIPVSYSQKQNLITTK